MKIFILLIVLLITVFSLTSSVIEPNETTGIIFDYGIEFDAHIWINMMPTIPHIDRNPYGNLNYRNFVLETISAESLLDITLFVTFYSNDEVLYVDIPLILWNGYEREFNNQYYNRYSLHDSDIFEYIDIKSPFIDIKIQIGEEIQILKLQIQTRICV